MEKIALSPTIKVSLYAQKSNHILEENTLFPCFSTNRLLFGILIRWNESPMPDISATEISKPLNWQDFQRGCVPLFRKFIDDHHLQEWGREGQKQNGIDLHGYRHGDTTKPVGVQCRRKKEPLTEKAMRDDAQAAQALNPPLTELIFATTADRDVKVQKAAANLTLELQESGWSCRVVVMSWQDLCVEIIKYEDALAEFLPSGRILQQPIIDVVREEAQTQNIILDEQVLLLKEIKESVSRPQADLYEEYDEDLAPEASLEPIGLHKEISAIKRFIDKGKTSVALEELEAMLLRKPALPQYATYRVLSNLAAIHFSSGRYSEAHNCTSKALELRPNDHKAQINQAFGELATGDIESAIQRAENVLKSTPDYGPAASVLLQSKMKEKVFSNSLELIPLEARGTAEYAIGAIIYLRRWNKILWRDLAHKAALDYPKNDIIRRFVAEAVLDPILNNAGVLIGEAVEAGVVEKVCKCAETLNDLWLKELARDDVNSDEVIPLANNLAAAKRFCGEDLKAADILDKTIQKIGHDPDLIRARILLYLHQDEDDKAVELIAETETNAELELLAVQVIVNQDTARALERLTNIDLEELPENLQPVVHEIRAEIALKEKNSQNLQQAIESMRAHEDSKAQCMLLVARGRELGLIENEIDAPALPMDKQDDDIEIDEDEIPSERKLASHIRSLIDFVRNTQPKLDFTDRVMLAQYLDRHNAVEVASDLLTNLIDTKRDSVALRTFLTASIAANLTARVKEIIDHLPSHLSKIPFYQRIKATYYWNTGDLGNAAPAIETLCKDNPKRLDYFDWRLQLRLRLEKEEDVRKGLAHPIENEMTGNLTDWTRLALALATYGYIERALKLSYRLLVTNREIPTAWMSFMSVMLIAGKSDNKELLTFVISEEHMFEVKFTDGTLRRFIVENDPEVLKVEPYAISPDHEIAKIALGHTPGDEIDWPSGDDKVVIENTKHKYLDAFHTALERYNERFPTAKDFRQVKVRLTGDDAFDEIKAEVKARSEYVRQQTESYTEGKMSLPMLAYMIGVGPIDTMVGISEVGTSYRVAVGTTAERDLAFKSIAENNGQGCVVDTATFHCIRRLELEETIVAICGKIGVTRATVDYYQRKLQEFDIAGPSESGSMGYRDGQFYMTEYSPEDRERSKKLIESDLRWLQENADILPAEPLQDPPPAIRHLGMLKEARFFDEVYAASGSDRLLLVDDLITRQIGAQIDVPGTWLQPILMKAREQEVLSMDNYTKVLTNLIGFGQTFITVDALVLAAAHKLDENNKDEENNRLFKLASSVLGGKQADINSHSRVGVVFLQNLWSKRIIELSDLAATSYLLRSLLRERTKDYQIILRALDHHVGSTKFHNYLRDWARGHFITW